MAQHNRPKAEKKIFFEKINTRPGLLPPQSVFVTLNEAEKKSGRSELIYILFFSAVKSKKERKKAVKCQFLQWRKLMEMWPDKKIIINIIG